MGGKVRKVSVMMLGRRFIICLRPRLPVHTHLLCASLEVAEQRALFCDNCPSPLSLGLPSCCLECHV